MHRLIHASSLSALLLGLSALVGCGQQQAGGPNQAQSAPEVLVALPISRKVIDYEDFPGRVEAVDSIDVRARVTGYLDKVNFTEGKTVHKNEVLFEIDPRPYQAELNRAEANLVQATARSARLESDFVRAQGLLPKSGISREDFDKIAGDRAEAVASISVAKANHALADLNLSFTKVRSPIDGRISRRYIDPGNLVKADDTVLTTIVSLDPIYASFDVDERTALRLQRLMRDGTIDGEKGGFPVQLGLADEEGYPRKGEVYFTDNRVDPETGTWRLRGTFQNPKHVLTPGLFVRMRLPLGSAFDALLIAEQALGTDQSQRFVYVVDEAGQVSYRRVKVGRLHDGLRVIEAGLKPGEQVVVSGLQRIRPGLKVAPKRVEMPEGLGNQAAGVKEPGVRSRESGAKNQEAPKGQDPKAKN